MYHPVATDWGHDAACCHGRKKKKKKPKSCECGCAVGDTPMDGANRSACTGVSQAQDGALLVCCGMLWGLDGIHSCAVVVVVVHCGMLGRSARASSTLVLSKSRSCSKRQQRQQQQRCCSKRQQHMLCAAVCALLSPAERPSSAWVSQQLATRDGPCSAPMLIGKLLQQTGCPGH